jgi:hypothetical protein
MSESQYHSSGCICAPCCQRREDFGSNGDATTPGFFIPTTITSPEAEMGRPCILLNRENYATAEEVLQLNPSSESEPLPCASELVSVEEERRIVCTSCNRRVARKGSTFCSRCTQKGTFNKLRDILPGIEIPREEQHEVIHHRPVENTVTVTELNGKLIYTRKQVAEMLGTSQTSICRWEKKGVVRPPVRHVASGQLIYTEEHVQELREYRNKVEIVYHAPVDPTKPESQQKEAAKSIGRKSFSIGRGLERAVASRLGRLSLIPGGNLLK